MTTCRASAELVEERINRVLTQYRESPKLLHVLRTYLGQVAEVVNSICAIPSYFDIETAVGDQLTILGKRLGFGRTHCVCFLPPLFGFDCDDDGSPQQLIVGFCDGNSTWANCGPFGSSDIDLLDDELYRKFLLVRRFQVLKMYDRSTLTKALQIFWGDRAQILLSSNRRVVIAPGRELTQGELNVLQLYPRVLPVAPGITTRFHFNPDTKVFGFGDGWGGFCESLSDEGLPLGLADGTMLKTEDGTVLKTGPLKGDAPWLCQIDVGPYDCAT